MVFKVYFWCVVRSLYRKAGEESNEKSGFCCNIRMKTGVQIIGGVLALSSGVILVAFFARLDLLISDWYSASFQRELTRGQLTLAAGFIVLAILVNVLLVLGGSGGRWRRILLLPWLLLYGAGIIVLLWSHLYLSSLCWKREKIFGALALAVGFFFLVIWALVWTVCAEISENKKNLIARHVQRM